MKETDDLLGASIDACDVRSLVAVAIKTAEGQVVCGGCTTVFDGNDVIDFKSKPAVILVELTVFAAMLGSRPNELREYFVHAIRRCGRAF